jgi:membrane protein YqaA with SNARE-associated domain
VYIVAGSLAGALVGYAIGSFAFNEWGTWLLGHGQALNAFTRLERIWFEHEFLITFTTAFVPIPKTPTILVAGFLSGSIPIFIVSWIIGRTLHFVAEAMIVRVSTSERLSYFSRVFSVTSILVLVVALGYIALTESGLAG